MEFVHRSVLLLPTVEALAVRPDGIYLDGTLGGAGHSYEIASRLTTGRLIGLDRDETALAAAGARLAPFAGRVTLVHSNFADLAQVLDSLDIPAVDGMLFDLGVSSPQLDDAERGFSYMQDAPLDMRMDRTAGLTAYEVVNTWPEAELKRILYTYGEERYAPRIAAAIAARRTERPIATTLELADLIRSAMPAQALRATVERCNGHCDAGKDDEFYKAPEHLRKIQTGPFYAIRLQRNFDVTMGGISINEHLQALRPDQSVIPGLYVTGDNASNWMGEEYGPMFSSFCWAMNSGYLAGEEAAAYVSQA